HSRRGAHDEATRVLRAVVDDATASDDHFMMGVMRIYLAEALQRAGDLSAAELELRGALPVLATFQPYLCLGTAQLADVLLAEGRVAEGLTPARAAFELVGSLGQMDEDGTLVRVASAEALPARGDHEAPRAVLGAAYDRLLSCWRRSPSHGSVSIS